MSSYEEIKSKAPHFMMLVQKSRVLAQQGKIEEAYQVAEDSLYALDLIEEYPNVLAAYVLATNVFSNYAKILEMDAYYAVPTACKGAIKLMAPFLCKYPQDENCMSLMLSLTMPLYFNFMTLMSDTFNFFQNSNIYTTDGKNNSKEIACISASMMYSAYKALKAINPGSPMVSNVQGYIDDIPDQAIIFQSVSKIPEYADRLNEILN